MADVDVVDVAARPVARASAGSLRLHVLRTTGPPPPRFDDDGLGELHGVCFRRENRAKLAALRAAYDAQKPRFRAEYAEIGRAHV